MGVVPKAKAKRYSKPAELLAAVSAWAAEAVPWAAGAGVVAELKKIGAIPGTDRRLEARAKKLHDELLSALNAADEFARETPCARRGNVYLLQALTYSLTPRGHDDLRSALYALNQRQAVIAESMTVPSDGWVALRHFVQEVGHPWPAPDRPEGFRFEVGWVWRKSKTHELTLDELVALAILAGHFDKQRASEATGRGKAHGGATVAEAVDALRKPMRKHVLSLTRVTRK